MSRSRLLHRLGLLLDRDAMHGLVVAATVCVLSLGLVYVGYLVHVWRVGRNAPCMPDRVECLLVFGKHAPGGQLDEDFQARLSRAAQLWDVHTPARILLLGGGPPGGPTEAALARDALWALGVAADAPLLLEDTSRDTLQNLRNARALLLADGDAATSLSGTVTLLSNRYHLARCALFARGLGFQGELCAAETSNRFKPALAWRLAGEAAYVCWIDLGTRWARLIGHRRMLARLS